MKFTKSIIVQPLTSLFLRPNFLDMVTIVQVGLKWFLLSSSPTCQIYLVLTGGCYNSSCKGKPIPFLKRKIVLTVTGQIGQIGNKMDSTKRVPRRSTRSALFNANINAPSVCWCTDLQHEKWSVVEVKTGGSWSSNRQPKRHICLLHKSKLEQQGSS